MVYDECVKSYYLACDLGGTNINIGLLQTDTTRKLYLIDSLKHKAQGYVSIGEALSHMLEQLSNKHNLRTMPPLCMCVSGPTDGEFCKPSNLGDGFAIERSVIEKSFNTRVALINDFSAVGYSIAAINLAKQAQHFIGSPTLMQQSTGHAHYLIVGAGTGLGTSQAHEYHSEQGRMFCVQPGEGGWADMAPSADSMSPALYNFLSQGGSKAVCWEDIVSSSKGIPTLHAFLRENNKSYEYRKAQQEIEAHSQHTGDIRESISILSRRGNLAAQAVLDLWIYLYGRCCSNYALLTLPKALFLAGGATEKNIARFMKCEDSASQKGRFLAAFQKGYNKRFETLLEDIPVYAFTDYNISLYGAAWYIAYAH